MKVIIFSILSLSFSVANSQEDEENKSQTNKPSWSEDMPERQDVPDLKFNGNVETDLDLGLGRKAMFDRDSVMNSDEDETMTELDDLNISSEESKQSELDATDAVTEAQRLADIAAEKKNEQRQ